MNFVQISRSVRLFLSKDVAPAATVKLSGFRPMHKQTYWYHCGTIAGGGQEVEDRITYKVLKLLFENGAQGRN